MVHKGRALKQGLRPTSIAARRRSPMPRQLFLNLPVANLKVSVAFFTQLGFAFNPQFTDETTTCMIINETAFVMLLEQERFASFNHGKQVADATQVEALFAFSVEKKEDAERMEQLALANGGKAWGPAADHGFMVQRSFQDLDGHVWEVVWMDPAHVMPQEG